MRALRHEVSFPPLEGRYKVYIVAGAERVKDETRKTYMEKFGLRILEGYGVTETAPALALNTPMFNKFGTVGRLLPGMQARLEKVEGVDEGGRLFLQGPNIMSGYVTAAEPLAWDAVGDDWLDTGDIVDVDAEGYVTIKGRAKRFAKIGGEMVSLTAVEGIAGAVWPDQRHAVVSIPDTRKGEKLVLVTDHAGAEVAPLAEWARANGAPELIVPKKIVKVAEVPVLGTGKTDYVSIQKMVEAEKAA